jgi:hypothetical protein
VYSVQVISVSVAQSAMETDALLDKQEDALVWTDVVIQEL